MKGRRLLIGGGIVVAVGAFFRRLRGRRRDEKPDPALELRRKLDESRAVAQDRDEFESAEVPVDQAEPGLDERRRDVRRRARSSIEGMRDSQSQ